MPSLVKVSVVGARDLPLSPQSFGLTDSYVNIDFAGQEQRTQVCCKTQDPVWREEFRFEIVDDSVLQDTPIELKVMDRQGESFVHSEPIGIVYIDLNPLIMRTAHDSEKELIIQGMFPIYDTLRGLRGSLELKVRLQFIGNDNPFRDSSAGVQFFSSSSLSPRTFIIEDIIGFVEDLVVDEVASSRTFSALGGVGADPQGGSASPSAAADGRLKVLYTLSAEVRREVGKKVLVAGGNAVLGYRVHLDMEGNGGLVARAYGTACRLVKVMDIVDHHAPAAVTLLDATGTGGTYASTQDALAFARRNSAGAMARVGAGAGVVSMVPLKGSVTKAKKKQGRDDDDDDFDEEEEEEEEGKCARSSGHESAADGPVGSRVTLSTGQAKSGDAREWDSDDEDEEGGAGVGVSGSVLAPIPRTVDTGTEEGRAAEGIKEDDQQLQESEEEEEEEEEEGDFLGPAPVKSLPETLGLSLEQLEEDGARVVPAALLGQHADGGLSSSLNAGNVSPRVGTDASQRSVSYVVLEPFGPDGAGQGQRNPRGIGAAPDALSKVLGDDRFADGVLDNLDRQVELISLSSFEGHVRLRLGGLVTAKSVKYLGTTKTARRAICDSHSNPNTHTHTHTHARLHSSVF